MIDMTPACRTTAGLLQALDESQLGNPTPCRDMDVAALLAHIGGLTLAFTAAAGKQFGELTDTGPTPDAALDADWRASYPGRLAALGADELAAVEVEAHRPREERREVAQKAAVVVSSEW